MVTTTAKLGVYDYHEHRIPGVIYYFCDECGIAVSMPHSSVYTIKAWRDKHGIGI